MERTMLMKLCVITTPYIPSLKEQAILKFFLFYEPVVVFLLKVMMHGRSNRTILETGTAGGI